MKPTLKWTGRAGAALALAGMAFAAGAETQERSAEDFDRVMFALPGQLTLERGDAFQLEIDAHPDDFERIETRVSGAELAIRWNDGLFNLFDGPKDPVKVRVTLPALRGLEVAGSGDVEGGDWVADTFSVEISGSGNVRFAELATEELDVEVTGSGNATITKVDAAKLRVEVSGSGDVELVGAADAQEIEIMGSGDVRAEDLEGARVNVEVMGSGDVTVWANETLSAEVMGSGDVRYRGNPRVDREEHGSGRVKAF